MQIKTDTAKPTFDPKQYEIRQDEKAGGGPSSTSCVFSGDNARVNINSLDRSANIVIKTDNVFAELKQQIEDHVGEENERILLLSKLESLRQARGTKTFSERYQEFIAAAANHITLVAPFIPILTQFLGN